MTDDYTHHVPRTKRRSASICAATSTSMEAISQSGGTPDAGTPQSRRRRPAARSQSARLTNNRSIRRKQAVAASASPNHVDKSHCNSEPKLAEQNATPDVSPNIRRKGSMRRGTSVYQRKSTAFLDVPDTRGSGRSSNTEEEDEDSYRLRSFSFTSKGIVNRGDSFRRRRSRSNSLCPPHIGGGTPSPVLDEPSEQNLPEVTNYQVALLGAPGVGKTALISQFMTSECINAYDRQKDILGAQTVSIMLNGEESELTFQNTSSFKEIDKTHPPDAFVVLYSVVDKASFLKAEAELTRLQDADLLRSRPAILVGNKIDLARSRAVSTQDGKCLACTFRAKFIEISVGINHNVDELLVGILTQIRLKVLNFEDRDHQQQWYKSRGMVKASMKARQMFTWLFGKEDSKFKNCENLHIL
ncbi:GTP-binding protein REM 1 [Aethina tumida]|uniref:GTP-binding protein REM 1 n=1 Tax=Aethina tumida TaxID=116153 RepID=UPI002147806B|nr:GTP-binding protein REM 1 [Aethina tumida]